MNAVKSLRLSSAERPSPVADSADRVLRTRSITKPHGFRMSLFEHTHRTRWLQSLSVSDQPLTSLRQTYSDAMFAEDSRGRLLRATATVVARQGVRACTVQDILDEAELSRRTFYKAFSNIEEALDTLFEVATDLMRSQIEEAVSDSVSAAESIASAVDAYLNLQVIGGRLIVALQIESRRPDSLLAPRRDALIDRFTELLRVRVEREQGGKHDELVYRAFVLTLESLVHHVQKAGRLTEADIARIRTTTLSIFYRALSIEG